MRGYLHRVIMLVFFLFCENAKKKTGKKKLQNNWKLYILTAKRSTIKC